MLKRMRREKLLRVVPALHDGEPWLSAAPAGRRRLNAARGPEVSDEWCVEDASSALLERYLRADRAIIEAASEREQRHLGGRR